MVSESCVVSHSPIFSSDPAPAAPYSPSPGEVGGGGPLPPPLPLQHLQTSFLVTLPFFFNQQCHGQALLILNKGRLPKGCEKKGEADAFEASAEGEGREVRVPS